MAEKKRTSIKHLQIDKSQSTMLAVIVAATVIVVFGLFATKAMIVKGAYQRRALHARRDVADRLKTNYDSAKTLFTQYKVFADQNPNVIGGSITGTTNLDGNNPRIVLDALPSSYDAPALASSIEKVLTDQSITINSLKVTDDPTANSDQAQTNPQSKAVIFSFEGTTSFAGGTKLLQDFERSIRPFDLNSLEISGTDTKLKLVVDMTTYYQPAKSLDLKATKEIK
ncbi:hypothetical protein KW801_00870 [Candidatus Saccharibacteria bacterium]|nr:hypothetical protein [Candidatus Saccharibacteria bacterium]